MSGSILFRFCINRDLNTPGRCIWSRIKVLEPVAFSWLRMVTHELVVVQQPQHSLLQLSCCAFLFISYQIMLLPCSWKLSIKQTAILTQTKTIRTKLYQTRWGVIARRCRRRIKVVPHITSLASMHGYIAYQNEGTLLLTCSTGHVRGSPSIRKGVCEACRIGSNLCRITERMLCKASCSTCSKYHTLKSLFRVHRCIEWLLL